MSFLDKAASKINNFKNEKKKQLENYLTKKLEETAEKEKKKFEESKKKFEAWLQKEKYRQQYGDPLKAIGKFNLAGHTYYLVEHPLYASCDHSDFLIHDPECLKCHPKEVEEKSCDT